MVLVPFQFYVLFFPIVGAVFAISYDTIAVRDLFAVEDEAVAVLRACFHVLCVEPIFDHLLG